MTVTVFDEFVQGSEAWLEARAGIVTASTIGQLVTPTLKIAANDTSRGLVFTLAAERITGNIEEVYVNRDMERGTLDEPYARDYYAEHYADVQEVGFIRLDTSTYTLGYSPDGLVGDDGLIEIKSRRQKKHLQTIMLDQVPRENMAQLQAGLLVTGRDWCDYISFCSGMPLFVKRVFPDPAWVDVLTSAAEKAETDIQRITRDYETTTKNMPATKRLNHFEEIY